MVFIDHQCQRGQYVNTVTFLPQFIFDLQDQTGLADDFVGKARLFLSKRRPRNVGSNLAEAPTTRAKGAGGQPRAEQELATPECTRCKSGPALFYSLRS
jgi:hypothetical protein